ncbi:MAG: hypothetical protein ACR2QE_01600 [Acidimicrobiales bacterium]
MPARLLATVLVAGLLAAACGAGDPQQTATSDPQVTTSQASDPPEAAAGTSATTNQPDGADPAVEVGVDPPPTEPIATDIPAVDTIDVRTGETVNLQSLVPSEKPLLFWFWAPH